jgi:tRNA nucleotidyltransferase (CCA-adding enzyme)
VIFRETSVELMDADASDHLGSWETFSHEADIGVRGRGRTKEDAFLKAALAMTSVVTDPRNVAPTEALSISCKSSDSELLLVDFLNAIIYEMATRRFLFGKFEVQIKDGELHAKIWGEKVDRAKHDPAVEIKGATYTELKVAQEADGSWIAQCVIDV